MTNAANRGRGAFVSAASFLSVVFALGILGGSGCSAKHPIGDGIGGGGGNDSGTTGATSSGASGATSSGTGPQSCDDPLNIEGCPCNPGDAPRACYPGPASQAGVGVCTKGTQSCNGTPHGEFGATWGACTGAGQPSACGGRCGMVDDGCGGQLDCGPCASCMPGSQTFDMAGAAMFTIPDYASLDVEVWGGGGGGDAWSASGSPTAGGDSSFDGALVAKGGSPGAPSSQGHGVGGVAMGGQVDTNGGDGGTACDIGPPALCGEASGGDAPNGGMGGGNTSLDGCGGGDGQDGQAPGGGGGGTWTCQGQWQIAQGWGMGGGGAGAGAYAKQTFKKGDLKPGTAVPLVVGAPGKGSMGGVTSGASGQNGKNPGHYTGGDGAAGRVKITWTCK